MKRSITAALALGLLLAVSIDASAAPKPKATPTPTPKPTLLDRLLDPFGKRATPTPKPTPAKSTKKSKKAPEKKPATPGPATAAKMIVVPPPAEPAITGGEPPKLITSEMSGKDLQFFMRAVEAGRIQAYMVQLLETRAASDQIKALGSALATTQEQENKQITRLAAAKGWTVTTEPTSGERAFGARVEKLEGQAFDKAVMDQVVATVQQSLSAYEEASHSEDPEIREFSVQMLPLAQEKLKFAEKMTGAGKEATQLFRKSVPAPTPRQSVSPAPADSDGTNPPPAIIPSKPQPVVPQEN